MNTFITRRAIFDRWRQVAAYEIISREEGYDPNDYMRRPDDTTVAQTIQNYSITQLTNGKPAYLSFSGNLILSEYPRLLEAKDIMVQLEEGISVTEELIAKIKTLKAHSYRVCLDNFYGLASEAALVPFLNVLKVDFKRTPPELRQAFTLWLHRSRQLTLLAQNVEKREDFEQAVKMGYRLFEGSFFENVSAKKDMASSMATIHMQILSELNRREDANFNKISRIIHTDARLTFMLMQRLQSLRFRSLKTVNEISQALVMMGLEEARRWILMVLANEHNIAESDELIRQAFLRGIFCRRLTEYAGDRVDSEDAFLLGMFSMLDTIMGCSMDELLIDVVMPLDVQSALLETEENFYYYLLHFVKAYEKHRENSYLSQLALELSTEQVLRLYIESIIETDATFTMIGERA